MAYSVYTREFDEVLRPADFLPEYFEAVQNKGLQQSIEDFINGIEVDASIADGIRDIKTAPTFLVDMSGSMRGHSIYNTVKALMVIGDALHDEGKTFEILGHTTKTWKGGMSRKKWQEEGREIQPGRLNDLRHVLLKEMGEDWAEVSSNLQIMLIEGMLKENIDGEAIQWARGRIEDRTSDQCMVIISDGAPVDDSTLTTNNANYLQYHLDGVLDDLSKSGISMRGIQIGRGYPEPKIPEGMTFVEIGSGPDSFLKGIVAATLEADADFNKSVSLDKYDTVEPS